MKMSYAKDYIKRYLNRLEEVDLSVLDSIIKVLFGAWKNGNSVFIIGNGGSASTASHMACDLSKGVIKDVQKPAKRMRVLSLTDNVAHMTALGNDLSYDEIFSEQLSHFAKPGDVLIAISASGNSPNIIKAVEKANSTGMASIGLLGFDGGKIKDMVDHPLIYPEKDYGRAEDFHLMVNHIMTERLRELIINENDNY